MSTKRLWIGSTVNQLEAHSHILINSKIAKCVESKLSTWQYIAQSRQSKLVLEGSEQTVHDQNMVTNDIRG